MPEFNEIYTKPTKKQRAEECRLYQRPRVAVLKQLIVGYLSVLS